MHAVAFNIIKMATVTVRVTTIMMIRRTFAQHFRSSWHRIREYDENVLIEKFTLTLLSLLLLCSLSLSLSCSCDLALALASIRVELFSMAWANVCCAFWCFQKIERLEAALMLRCFGARCSALLEQFRSIRRALICVTLENIRAHPTEWRTQTVSRVNLRAILNTGYDLL